jgi:hypothetical protein
MTRGWWIVFGALAGAVLLGGGGFLASLLFPGVRDVTPQPFINLLGHTTSATYMTLRGILRE